MSDCRAELEALLGRDRVGSLASSPLGREGVSAFSVPPIARDRVGALALPPLVPSDGDAALPLAQPSSEAELVELLRYASHTSRKVLPVGFGSKLAWSRAPEHVDFALSTRALAGIVAYEPEDGTLTALAGSTIAELAEVARRGGNHLTPDVARPSGATLGGVLAAGQSGIDRTRYGPSRHHVLGMRIAFADGTIARSGGRLVKNVTGFDMHRLYCGSHGTLGVIVECSLRLFPAAESPAMVCASAASASDALRAARTITDGGAQPYALVIESSAPSNGAWTVHVALAGRREPVEWEIETARRALPGAAIERDEGARDAIALLRDRTPASGARISLRIGVMPSRLENALELLESRARSSGARLELFIQPTLATIDASMATRGGVDASTAIDASCAARSDFDASAEIGFGESDARALIELVRNLRDAKLDVRVHDPSLEIARSLDPVGDLGPGLDWMRRLKHALDPAGVFPARGFQVGG